MLADISFLAPVLLAALTIYAVRRILAVPAELAHLPRVPVLPTLLSYAKGEVEEVRIKKLILPFANEKGEGLVLIFALGRWIVHIIDRKLGKDLTDDIVQFPKEVPPDGLLLWRFVGYSNIILSNGESWKRHSHIVRSALNRNVPIEAFAELSHKLFSIMDKSLSTISGGWKRLQWDDYTMRFTLDAVGSTALGHNFDAITDPNTPFVNEYNHVMESIANPLYLVFPFLEKLIPRVATIRAIDKLVDSFQGVLESKKENKGNDMMTYMLEEPGMVDVEYRDNMVVFFIAGHDTTAGAVSSLCYYFAKHPEYQERARKEVLEAMKDNKTGEPTMAELKEMPFVQACIRESLRINTPITYMVPRTAKNGITLTGSGTRADVPGKSYYLPAGTSVILNITSIHYNEYYWPNANTFDPERFMGMGAARETEIDSSMWLPFALGPRQCPARNFAMYEQRVLVAMLLREWDWKMPEKSVHSERIQNGFSPFALSLPKELYIDFKRRTA